MLGVRGLDRVNSLGWVLVLGVVIASENSPKLLLTLRKA
jgi:hypothetical protein